MNIHYAFVRLAVIGASIAVSLTASAEPSPSDKSSSKSAATAPAKSQGKSSLSGRYVYAGAKSEKKAISDMIDEILYTLEDSIRMTAQERLQMKTRVSDWVSIKQTGSKVVVHFEGREPDVMSFDGPTSGMDPEGNPAELKLSRSGDSLVHTITTAEGTRINTLKPQSDGSLLVAVELRSPRLQKPLRWSLTYKKR